MIYNAGVVTLGLMALGHNDLVSMFLRLINVRCYGMIDFWGADES